MSALDIVNDDGVEGCDIVSLEDEKSAADSTLWTAQQDA